MPTSLNIRLLITICRMLRTFHLHLQLSFFALLADGYSTTLQTNCYYSNSVIDKLQSTDDLLIWFKHVSIVRLENII